jgi:zeta-carotene desaturase
MLAMLRMGFVGRSQHADRTFADFLHDMEQPPEAIDRFWRVVVVSACNLAIEEVAASYAIQVFQEGFLGHRFGSAIGLARVALSDLYDPVEAHLERVGGTVQLGTSARAIAFDGDRVSGVVTEHGVEDAAAVIAAVPFDRLAKLCSATLTAADSRLQHLDELRTSPILGVHLFFESKVMTLPHLVLPGRDTHWLFNKGADEQGRQHIHAVISGADNWMDLEEREIVDRVLEDLVWALPAARGLEPSGFRSVKEKRATFRAEPGVDRLRPVAAPGIGVRNLFLAGDWCQTGWPATMEGAVRSGYAAAAAATGAPGVVADLPVALGGRLLGLR